MKLVLRTLFFHFLSIFTFTLIYYSFPHEFKFSQNHNATIYDFLLLATTIQAGVGVIELYPLTIFGKMMVTIQQWIMLCTHVISLYIFTL